VAATDLSYNDQVRATAPQDRLLEWRLGDGWGPICSALGLTVPDHPFPRMNTAEQTRAELGFDAT